VERVEWGPLLKAARWQAGLSQRQLARAVGVPSSTLSRYETGAMLPSLRMLDRVLAACGKDLQATLVQRHADVDAELDRLAGLSLRDRLHSLGLVMPWFMPKLAALGSVLVGGAWAAAIHGIPREHSRGRCWVAGDEDSLTALAAALTRDFACILEDGQFCGLQVRAGTFARNPTATWRINLVGQFETVVVPPGQAWPAEIRIDTDAAPLRVVAPDSLTEQDGVRPELLARWLARRA
jgi:transcriptional regulator with XRE-family HTH domain